MMLGVVLLLVLQPMGRAIEPLTIQGQNFVTTNSTPARFWGVNLGALYPTHLQAQNLASNLSSTAVNLVRLHHDLRNSLDWNTESGIGALAAYVTDSRTPNTNAWERYDYLNSQLQARGIYIVVSMFGTRSFMPGDVDILTTSTGDRTNWMNAVTALNNQNAPDLVKLVPMIDERCARLMIEFATNMVTHVNPYTGLAYGKDPQVLYLETMNECSAEYTIVAGNQFPSGSYFDTILQSNWTAYCVSSNVTTCNIYSPSTQAQQSTRDDFLRGLDLAFYTRLRNAVGATGCQKPMEFSNLWRGEAFQKMSMGTNDVIEDHQYQYPRVAASLDDVFHYTTWSCVTGKPYFVGELNQQESTSQIATNAPYRTMLEVASSAYGLLNDWSGIVWFAWEHGDRLLGYDGWSLWEERTPHQPTDMLGEIHSDGMMLDHFRTAGIIFRNGYVAKSTSNIVLYVDNPLNATSGYWSLMTPKYDIKPGWQDIHSIRRAFGTVPTGQSTAAFMTTTPTSPIISDTSQIIKNTSRKQLSVSAPKAEAFSGTLDSSQPSGLSHLQVGGTNGGFATLILVSNDGNDITNSQDLFLSQTYLDPSFNELTNMTTTLNQMAAPGNGMAWFIQRTRPRGQTGYQQLTMSTPGQLVLPSDPWHECELKLANVGTLPTVQSTIRVDDTVYSAIREIFKDCFMASTPWPSYQLNAQAAVEGTSNFTPVEGSASIRLMMSGGYAVSRVNLVLIDDIWNMSPMDCIGIKNVAGLHFWFYPKPSSSGAPTLVPSFSVELICTNGAGQLVETSVPLTNYLSATDYTNRWKEVVVPFTDFPNTGFYYSGSTTNSAPFLWSSVVGVGFYCSTIASGYYDPHVDDIDFVYTVVPPPVGGGTLAPTANFTASSRSGVAPLPVAFTDTTVGSPTSWVWSFGDTGTSTAQNPSYTYNTTGTYTVSLIASNAGGSSSITKSNYITVNVVITGQPSTMTLQVNTHGSGYQGEVDGMAGFYLTWSSYQETAMATLGDPTSVQSIPLMLFADNSGTGIGTIPSGATVTNAILTLYITATWSPSGTDILYAAPIATAWTCCTNTILPTIISNSAVSAVIPNLAYPATGTINLDVTSIVQSWVNGSRTNLGLAFYTDAQYRGVQFETANFGYNGINAPLLTVDYLTGGGTTAPTASFTASPTNGVAPRQVLFTDTSTGSPTSWAWDFGDTGTSTAQNPSHTYSTGVYTARLSACNAGGCSTNTKAAYISVITAAQSWQNYYGVSPNTSDPYGKGISNTNAFLAGFNPTNLSAYPHIISAVKSGSNMTITYLGSNGDTNYPGGPLTRTNVLQFATGTANGSYTNNFTGTVQTNILNNGTGSGIVTNMVDVGGATNTPSRYYRIRVLVP